MSNNVLGSQRKCAGRNRPANWLIGNDLFVASQGWIDRATGEVQLEFKASFWFTATSLYKVWSAVISYMVQWWSSRCCQPRFMSLVRVPVPRLPYAVGST